MDHEDNFLQNVQQNMLVDNVQIASGGDVGGLVTGEEIVAGIGGNVSGKYEEHEEHDDGEEWKYIKEVHQSEKQQTMKIDGVKEAAAAAAEAIVVGVGNGNGTPETGESLLLAPHNEMEIGNGVAAGAAGMAADEEDEVEIIKNNGDFSTTSNTMSTPAEEEVEALEADVLQVEMKIETSQQMQQLENMAQHFGTGADEEIEEEPSSLATNTTNGTSSLSENPPQQLHDHKQEPRQHSTDDKENVEPITAEIGERPAGFDFDLASHLNPEAKEFVPSFGSPTSPGAQSPSLTSNDNIGEFIAMPHPNAVPRHLLGTEEDDFLARSPARGRGVEMDSIRLPGENEFDHEADMRPHELGEVADDEVAGEDVLQQQPSFMLANVSNFNDKLREMEEVDHISMSPASFIDHGPETSVDLDAEPAAEGKKAVQAENADSSIEEILNSVQPLPVDFENDFAANGKELLQVEEKEHVSHSPSTEEILTNLMQDDQHLALQQNPLETKKAGHMQDSFYMEETSSQHFEQQQPEIQHTPTADESLLIDTSNPFDSSNVSFGEASIETMRDHVATDEPTAANILTQEIHCSPDLLLPTHTALAPKSPEEQHLMEETKDHEHDFEHKMGELLMKDGNLTQLEEVAAIATTINKSENPFLEQRAFQPQPHKQLEQHHDELEPEEFIQQNEPIDFNEQHFNDQLAQLKFEQECQLREKDAPLSAPDDASQEIVEVAKEAISENISQPINKETNEAAVAAGAGLAAAAAGISLAAGAAAAKKSAAAPKKPTAGTKTAPAAKTRVSGDVKKPTELAKKPIKSATATTTAAPRPRTAPAKSTSTTSATAEKKTAATLSAKPAASTAARKPLAASTASKTSVASKPAATARPAAARTSVTTTSTAAKPAAPRVGATSSLHARKPAATNGATTAAAAAKPRPATAPTKPTTLGITATAKPKISPRSTLTSQLRKPAGAVGAKSPTKAAPSASSVSVSAASKSSATSVTTAGGSRTKTSTTTTTTTTKTFTARPAPKIPASSTATTTTTRRSLPAATLSNTTKTSSTTLRKPSPTKPSTRASPNSKGATTAAALKSKTKEASNEKPSPIRAPVKHNEAVKLNGDVDPTHLNGESNGLQERPKENGAEVHTDLAVEATLIDA